MKLKLQVFWKLGLSSPTVYINIFTNQNRKCRESAQSAIIQNDMEIK